jgi:hypothetical protein
MSRGTFFLGEHVGSPLIDDLGELGLDQPAARELFIADAVSRQSFVEPGQVGPDREGAPPLALERAAASLAPAPGGSAGLLASLPMGIKGYEPAFTG